MLFFHIISANASADLRSPEKEVYFRSWDLANSQCMLYILKYTKTCINIILYNFKNTIVSALNFNILKKNLSKIAYKEVKILCFSKLFSKNGICATVIICVLGFFVSLILIYYQTVLEIRKACQNSFAEL